jgi:hypothetical protein
VARKVIGVLIGHPSIWPYLRIGFYSPGAFALLIVALAFALAQVADRKRIPDVWLFFLLCFAAPLFLLGFFSWYVPPRYTEFALLPMLICALSPWQYLRLPNPVAALAVAAGAGLIVVNPVAVRGAINAGKSFADHRGAAEYMRSVQLRPRDVVIAEEVLMQTYYLGHVDYWLYDAKMVAEFVVRVNGRFVDEYTHTPIIGTGAEFRALLDNPNRGAIYVVGSGEDQEDGRLLMRGAEMSALLKSPIFTIVYASPDGRTQVFKADEPNSAVRQTTVPAAVAP